MKVKEITTEDKLIQFDGFDDAVIGIKDDFNNDIRLAYDYNKCITILMKKDGMSLDEAAEYMDHNVLPLYAGRKTPVFIYKMTIKETERFM